MSLSVTLFISPPGTSRDFHMSYSCLKICVMPVSQWWLCVSSQRMRPAECLSSVCFWISIVSLLNSEKHFILRRRNGAYCIEDVHRHNSPCHYYYKKHWSTALKNLTVTSAIDWGDYLCSSILASMILLTAKIYKNILALQFTDM